MGFFSPTHQKSRASRSYAHPGEGKGVTTVDFRGLLGHAPLDWDFGTVSSLFSPRNSKNVAFGLMIRYTVTMILIDMARTGFVWPLWRTTRAIFRFSTDGSSHRGFALHRKNWRAVCGIVLCTLFFWSSVRECKMKRRSICMLNFLFNMEHRTRESKSVLKFAKTHLAVKKGPWQNTNRPPAHKFSIFKTERQKKDPTDMVRPFTPSPPHPQQQRVPKVFSRRSSRVSMRVCAK